MLYKITISYTSLEAVFFLIGVLFRLVSFSREYVRMFFYPIGISLAKFFTYCTLRS